MLAWRAVYRAALILFLLPALGLAQDVTLTSRDGSVQISGELAGYDGEFYRVDSVYGVLTVDGSGVVCSGPACPDLTAYVAEIRMAGEPVVLDHLIPALIDAFAERSGYTAVRQIDDEDVLSYRLKETESDRDAARIILRRMNTREAFADLVAEETDLVLAAREVTPDEVALGLDAGLGQLDSPAQSRVLALDALVPIVAATNPVKRVSPIDLASAFRGMIRDWQDLGGADAPIYLHLPQDRSAISQLFAATVLGAGATPFSKIERHDELGDLVTAIADDPFGLGITTLSGLVEARALPLIDSCGYISAATPDALKSEDYPLTAPIFLYLPSRRLPAVGRDFLRFTRSAAAQQVIRQAGFADQGLTETPLGQQGDRLSNAIRAAGDETGLDVLQEMMVALDGYNRLSVSFRFDGGAAALDAQSRSNIGLLAQAVETGLFDGRRLIFVGFSDGDGDAAENTRLSLERAVAVKDDVVTEAATADQSLVGMEVLGFGEALPMACDDTDWGRRINRRVEVWVR